MQASYFVVLLAIALLRASAEETPNEEKEPEGRQNNCPVPSDDDPDFFPDIDCGYREGPVYLCDDGGKPCEKFICRCTEARNSDATGWYRYGAKYPESTTESPMGVD